MPIENQKSIIIDKCGPKDYKTFWDTIYIWFIPSLITFLILIIFIIIIELVDNPILNFIGYLCALISSIYIPYLIMSKRISNIKQNCYNFGQTPEIPFAIPINDDKSDK